MTILQRATLAPMLLLLSLGCTDCPDTDTVGVTDTDTAPLDDSTPDSGDTEGPEAPISFVACVD